jgi:exopolysaccharide production protein ExoQ
MPFLSRARPAFEFGLDLCVFAFLPLLTLFSRAAAPLAAVAGVCAFGLATPGGLASWRRLWKPAALFAALLAWGLLSTLWAVAPARSLVMTLRLLGLFAVGLSLVAAVPALAAPQRLVAWFCAGLVLALCLTLIQYETMGALTQPFIEQPFYEPRLNQVENGFVLLALPLVALLALQRRFIAAALFAVAIDRLVGDAAQLAFVVGIGAAILVYLQRRWVVRMAAGLAALVVIMAPLVFPQLIRLGDAQRWANALKPLSVWHRLEIWSFVGARIAERPLLGWGLDSSRAIPGGSALTPGGVPWLPLHPHNVTLQIWLELGVPGAVLFVLLIGGLWLALGRAPWPRLYAAAAGGSLAAGFIVALGSYGLWQEWWIGSEFLALFLILAMGRLSSTATPPRGLRHQPAPPPGHPP